MFLIKKSFFPGSVDYVDFIMIQISNTLNFTVYNLSHTCLSSFIQQLQFVKCVLFFRMFPSCSDIHALENI